MKKVIILSIISVASLILFSYCSNIQKENIEPPLGMISLDLSKFGKQFSIFVPDTNIAKIDIREQSWGALEIKVGKEFHLSITEDPGDIELVKSDIKSNDVNIFKSYLIDEPLTIVWESQIIKPEYHFYSIQRANDNTYVFQDVMPSNGEPIHKEAILKMVNSVKKIIPKEIKKFN